MMAARGMLILTVLAGISFLAVLYSRGEGENGMKKDTARVVRRAVGAGKWYPASGHELGSMVSNFMAKAKAPAVNGRIIAAIAPHAGYIYSGPVAGYTFRAIKDNAQAGNKPDTIVILGFSHRDQFPGLALMDGDAIQTPLGEAALDKEAGEILTNSSPAIYFNYKLHGEEHSAENEIPFAQAALPGTPLVVGLIGSMDQETIKALVVALGELAKKKKILVVASSDMLHDYDYDLVTRTDKATLEKVVAMDYASVMKMWGYSRQVFCGIAPVQAVMQFAASQGCKKATLLHYNNSGDEHPVSMGNYIVGYGAVVFTAGEK
jgi:AmmeMemoRadiSam system protein B